MMRALATLLVLTAVAGAQPAHTDEPNVAHMPPTAAHAPPTAAEEDRGKGAYVDGRRMYEQRDWAGAIAKFQESYRLRHDAASLFDMAQAYRLSGDCNDAKVRYIEFHHEFPNAPNIAKVDKFIADLVGTCPSVREPAAPVAAAPVAPIATRPARASSPMEPGDRRRSLRLAGLSIAGAGVALAAGGFGFGARAQHFSTEVQDGGGTWNTALQAHGKRDAAIADAMWGVGGAAVIAGVVMFALGHRTEHIAIAPGPGGASVAWACAF